MLFTLLIAFSALFVAGCAAFFSIRGLVVLFAGSAIAIGVMASSLEIGKLMAASFLHRHWKDISWTLRTYLCVAVMTLVCITSLGIFGFLTNAYQQHASLVTSMEVADNLVIAKKKNKQEALQAADQRIKLLAEQRVTQEQCVKDSGNYKAPRDAAYKAIAEANTEIAEKEKLITDIRTDITALDEEQAQIAGQLATKTDIGSFRFIAKALGVEIDMAVRYFILALIFVFDPLAVSLVLALNVLLEKRIESRKIRKPGKSYIAPEPVVVPEVWPDKPTAKDVVEVEAPEVIPPPSAVEEIVVTELPTKEEVMPENLTEAEKEEYRRRRRSGKNNSVVTS